jgi:hypothetical protein
MGWSKNRNDRFDRIIREEIDEPRQRAKDELARKREERREREQKRGKK